MLKISEGINNNNMREVINFMSLSESHSGYLNEREPKIILHIIYIKHFSKNMHRFPVRKIFIINSSV